MKTFILWEFDCYNPDYFRLIKIKAKNKKEVYNIMARKKISLIPEKWNIYEIDNTKQYEEIEYL